MERKRIKFDKKFIKSYELRIKKNKILLKAFRNTFELFSQDPHEKSLRVHSLSGPMWKLQAIDVTNDIRIIFLETNNFYIFLDIGNHDEVYRK